MPMPMTQMIGMVLHHFDNVDRLDSVAFAVWKTRSWALLYAQVARKRVAGLFELEKGR